MELLRDHYYPFVGLNGPIAAFSNPIPPGLSSLYSVCQRLYSNQPNPLQVNASLKYW